MTVEKKTVAQHVNPGHYQDIVPGFSYSEAMEHILKGHDGLEAHLLGQVYKYLMRLGKKDGKLQDSKKAHWYLTAYVMMLRDGKHTSNDVAEFTRLLDEPKTKPLVSTSGTVYGSVTKNEGMTTQARDYANDGAVGKSGV